jgi:anaerobic magnesium-protoporphyrin IX monomethyl ester cyclase
MKITLISPRITIQKNDILGSGVPYWPIELVTFASHIKKNDEVNLIDLFGNNPNLIKVSSDDHYLQGESIETYKDKLNFSDVYFIFAISFMSHHEILDICKFLKKNFPQKKIIILENSQAVTGYSIDKMSGDFFSNGADFLLCGEPYFNWHEIRGALLGDFNIPENLIKNESLKKPRRLYEKNFKYPVPSWELVNLKNYWSLPYSHGPKLEKKFLPILTSRGCPYPCDFCVVPDTNDRIWRSNFPNDVVDEIIYLKNKYNVNYFQIEDLNPTIKNSRWIDISKILLKKNVQIKFAFVSGTKAETIKIDQLKLLYDSGCRYISISPESGSSDIMSKIGKKFDYAHALSLVKNCKKNRITTQACFVIGHPDEKNIDFIKTQKYLKELIKNGLDEAAFFIVSPFAGSKLFNTKKIQIDKDKIISFSPIHRKNYLIFDKRRKKLIFNFITYKLFFQFSDTVKLVLRSIFGNPKTKMENLPRRVCFVLFYIFINKFKSIYEKER